MVSKEVVAKAVISEIEKDNKASRIETDLIGDYSSPSKIVWKSSNKGHVPDIKANTTKGVPVIYEIELSDEFDPEKWRLFSLYALKSKGRFVLVIPEIRLKKISSIIKKKELNNVQLLTFAS